MNLNKYILTLSVLCSPIALAEIHADDKVQELFTKGVQVDLREPQYEDGVLRTCHGGVITALAEQAAGIAITSGLPRGRIGVTVEIKVNFLAPADGSELIARAKTLKMSGSIGVATVEIFSKSKTAETLCAFCTATMRALDLPAEFR